MPKPTDTELEQLVTLLEEQSARRQETDAQIAVLFRHAPLGIAYHRLVSDSAGKPVNYFCLKANATYRKLTGVDPTGRLITEAYPGIEHDPFDWIGNFGRVVATGKPLKFKRHFQTNQRWYEGVAYRYQPGHFVLIFFEITETKKVEACLRESNANFQQLVDAMQGLLFVVGANGDLRFANQRAAAFLTDNQAISIIGRNLGTTLPSAQTVALVEECGQVLATNEPRQQQVLLQTDGGSRWFDRSLTPIRYGTPPQPAVLALMVDITAQMTQQEYLRQSEAQYRTLFESMQEGAINFASPGELLGMNPAAQRILGYSPAELQHHLHDDSLLRISYEDGRRCTRDDNPIAHCFATGRSEAGVIFKSYNPKTNRDLWIIANVTPLFREYSAVPAQVIATFNDITDRIRLRETNKARVYLLENSHRWSLGQLLQETIAKLGQLLDSPIGCYHFVDQAQQRLSLQAWLAPSPSPPGRAGGYNRDHPPVEETGLWLDCLRQRRTIIVNYQAPPALATAQPPGQVGLVRALATPIFRGQKIVAILGIGNKSQAYNEEDAAQAEHFADLAWELVEQKQMEEERQESRRKLKALISNLPGMVFSVDDDPDRTIRFVSDGCQALTGYSARELVDRTSASLAALIHPQDREPVRDAVRRAVTAHRSYEVEYRLLHADGQERAILERGAATWDRNSAQPLVEGFAIDITAQRYAAQQIKASHQQLLTILDSIEAQVFVADMETHEVLFMNKRTKELFGENGDHQPCYRIFQDQTGPCPFCTNDRLLDECGEPGPVCQWEHRNPITGRWYVNHDRAVRWLNGKIVRMQVAFDNTERKKTERKLFQAQKMEAIGLLAGGVAHDFNNILSVILGYTTMALEELGDRSLRVKRDLLQIQKAGVRAKDLVRQILAFSHHTEERIQPLKLHLIIKEVIKMLRSSFPATIHISAQISVIELTVLADPTKMHQLLMNLCTNALHAMKDGGALTIGLQQVDLDDRQGQGPLRELPAGSYARLYVKDTGTGMPADLLDKIFDPFFTTKAEGEGTGLGLAMVQGIVEAYKGAIVVDSRLGEGTAFTIYLPELPQPSLKREDEDKEALPTGTETIMLIDDEPAVAMILQRLLSHLNYTVEAFTDSGRAIEAYTRDPEAYALVITDMTMPKFTGIAIARAMLALRPDQPIILCTGFSEAVDEVKARAEGIKSLLAKPISQETLAKAVRQTLDQAPSPAVTAAAITPGP